MLNYNWQNDASLLNEVPDHIFSREVNEVKQIHLKLVRSKESHDMYWIAARD